MKNDAKIMTTLMCSLSSVSTNFWILSSGSSRTRRDLAIGEERLKKFVDTDDKKRVEVGNFLGENWQLGEKEKHRRPPFKKFEPPVGLVFANGRLWVRKVENLRFSVFLF